MAIPPNLWRINVGKHSAHCCAHELKQPFISLPDVHRPAFKAEAQQQSLAAAQSAQSVEDQAFIDAVSDQPE